MLHVLREEILISDKTPGSWLFLLFNLPAKQSSGRVKVWRRLKKFGAIQLKTSTYVLPDEPVQYERFQWLAKEIVDTGGEATLVRVKDIEGMPHAAIVALFNEARAREYDELSEPLNLLIKGSKTRKQSRITFLISCKSFASVIRRLGTLIIFRAHAAKICRGCYRKQKPLNLPKRDLNQRHDSESRIIEIKCGLLVLALKSIASVRLG